MQQRFLLQILLLAQHVSDTTMPIIMMGIVVPETCFDKSLLSFSK